MAVGPDASELRAQDADEVEALLLAAFARPAAAALVRVLRESGAKVSERIMRVPGRIGAYAGISRMVAPEGWFALAPVAVLPAWQNGAPARDWPGMEPHLRLGNWIARQTASLFSDHADILRRKWGDHLTPTLVVLGKPSFYSRCGFSRPRAARLSNPYPVASTLIARECTVIPQERLVYPAAFDGV